VTEFVEVNLMRGVPEVVTASGEFPIANDAGARLLVRLSVGVAPPGMLHPFTTGGEPIRFASSDPAGHRGGDRVMHSALGYGAADEDAVEMRPAGEIRRALRTVLRRAGVPALYPVGRVEDRFDPDGFELDIDVVTVGNSVAVAARSDEMTLPGLMAAHRSLLAAYPVADDGFTPSSAVWSHLEVFGEAITALEAEVLISVLRRGQAEPTPQTSAAARRAGRRLADLGAERFDDRVAIAYLASAVDHGDLDTRWRLIERTIGTDTSDSVSAEKQRVRALLDPRRFGPVAFTTRRICRLYEATPWELGVEKAAVRTADAHGHLPFMSPGRPQRLLELALTAALEANGVTVIVLRGASGAGKSRLAYEVANALARDAWVVAPRSAEFTARVYDPSEHAVLTSNPQQPVILWLDDVELHIGTKQADGTTSGLTRSHIDHLREASVGRPMIVLATAGGKGYRVHQEAGTRAELQRLGLEIDQFMRHADVTIPVNGSIPRDTVAAALGDDAADEITTNGIGSYALRTEILSAFYLHGDWPSHIARPAGDWREGQALADALLSWRMAAADEPVDMDTARVLWAHFRERRGLYGPPDDSSWRAALDWATATAVAHQPLVHARADQSLDVNDHLRDISHAVALVEHLLRLEPLPARVAENPFEVGVRLHLDAPAIALEFYRRAMAAGDPHAANNIGALLVADRPDDATVYFRTAIEHGDSRAHRNLGVLLEKERPLEARQEYRRAIATGDTSAYVLLAKLIEPHEPQEALSLLRDGAQSGDTEAMLEYAIRCEDDAQARHVLELAGERGNARAVSRLALTYLDEDRDKALELFERAGRMGDPLGYFAKANCLDQQSESDSAEALELYRAAAEGGVPEAMFNVAAMLSERDPDEAEAYYERAVAHDHVGAMTNLGHRLRRRNPARAEELFRRAIACDEASASAAMSNLADLLLLEDDRDAATSLLRRAAELGDAHAMFNLAGLLIADHPDEAVPLLEAAGELEHADSIVHLSYLLRDREPERAKALMRRAADMGNPNAQNNLAIMLADDDPAEAEALYQAAAEGGQVTAMVNLARGLLNRDTPRALRLLRRAASAGNADAAELLVDLVEPTGDDVPEATAMVNHAVRLLDEDPATAGRLMESAAALGNPTAIVNLAVMEMDTDHERALLLLEAAVAAGSGRAMLYLADVLAGSEPAAAETLLRRAAAQGEPGALTQLALHIERQDPSEAFSLFEVGAADGDPSAMLQLARLLLPSDRDAAIAWLRQASAAGDREAMHNLGVLLWEEGLREGLEYFQQASDAGNPSSSLNLGLLLEEGNPDEALRYFERAAEAGVERAVTHIEDIRRRRGADGAL